MNIGTRFARLLALGAVTVVLAACYEPGTSDVAGADTPTSDITDVATPTSDVAGVDTPTYAVTFRDRTIDLEPFLTGFPYSSHRVDIENGHLLYFKRSPEGRWLYHQELGREGTIDHAAGRRLNDIDWSNRSFGGTQFHPPTGRLLFTSDEANDEHFNVYSMDLDDGTIERLTDNDYTYSWDLSEDDRYLAYLARTGLKEMMVTTLRVRDLETGEDRAILSDEGGKDRFTWGKIRFTPDNNSVVLTVQHDGQRNTKSLARINLDGPARFDYIHPPRVLRYGVGQIDGWVRDGVFLYVSAEEGFANVYRYDLADGSTQRLTDFKDPMGSRELLETEQPTLLVVLRRPHESELQVLDADTGKLLHSETIAASVDILDGHGPDVIADEDSLASPWTGKRLHVDRNEDSVKLNWSPFAGVPDQLLAKISHYEVERVAYPTFDMLADGSARMLHGFLLTPKAPPADPANRMVRIKSFYGGGNHFDTSSQMMAAAGIATFSPSPRGSSGFGAEFAALNDGDLGGDEIVDILYAGKWLVSDKGYQPHQVGVYGGSHGGYATMRALTFPPATNDRDASFDFGFGWSHAGFSNILTFYESCNIPDWVIKEAGDPATEADKLLDRSPISHVDRLRSPILLTHGSNDWRVPVVESRTFVEKARELDRAVTYVEFEGQGHGIRGFDNLVRYHQAVFDFFETVSAEHNAAH